MYTQFDVYMFKSAKMECMCSRFISEDEIYDYNKEEHMKYMPYPPQTTYYISYMTDGTIKTSYYIIFLIDGHHKVLTVNKPRCQCWDISHNWIQMMFRIYNRDWWNHSSAVSDYWQPPVSLFVKPIFCDVSSSLSYKCGKDQSWNHCIDRLTKINKKCDGYNHLTVEV